MVIRMKEFVDFILHYCYKIEDRLTIEYYSAGQTNKLEILKRRYKADWGDTSRSVEVSNKTKADDAELKITISEA